MRALGRVYRPVRVGNGSKESNTVAFIDTGADESVMSERLANMLNLKLKGRFRAISASGHIIEGKYTEVSVEDISKGYKTKLKMGVTDSLFEDEVDEEGVEVIIGIDFLQYTNYRIEF